jgi:hypothetical protein
MKRILFIVVITSVAMACGNSSGESDYSDTTINSTTPPPKQDTNPIGIMMGDSSIGINDSLKIDSFKK